MRLALTGLLLFSVASFAEESKEEKAARDLFEAMEKKLAAAKSLRVVCKASEPREKGDRHDASFWTSGGKVRFEFDWWAQSRGAVKWTSVSNGESVWSTQKKGEAKKAGKDPARAIAVGFARTGTLALTEIESAMVSGADPGDGTQWQVSGFKAGAKETKDGVELQSVEYKVQKGKADPIAIVVWIDTKTQLPKRREVDISGWKLSETYEACELDAKIADGQFAQPK
ncbi:MAG: hypothetical protein FD180_4323 [Planctomycetota bacterium]|nr:MAG: hypothetical protein FD180_4323 [Planctomycetota bacterium]